MSQEHKNLHTILTNGLVNMHNLHAAVRSMVWSSRSTLSCLSTLWRFCEVAMLWWSLEQELLKFISTVDPIGRTSMADLRKEVFNLLKTSWNWHTFTETNSNANANASARLGLLIPRVEIGCFRHSTSYTIMVVLTIGTFSKITKLALRFLGCGELVAHAFLQHLLGR